MIDGSLNTNWTGNPSDASWTIILDMGVGAVYNEILIANSVYLQSYEVKVSDSATGPFEIVTRTIYSAPIAHKEWQFDGYTTNSVSFPVEISKRYIQILIYEVDGDGSMGPELREIKVFNQQRTPDPSPTPEETMLPIVYFQ